MVTKSKTLVGLVSITLGLILTFSASLTLGKSKNVRKVQEVDFEQMDLKGTVRNPDGAFLVQKRGIKFMPLMDLKKDMDAKIRDSVQYVR